MGNERVADSGMDLAGSRFAISLLFLAPVGLVLVATFFLSFKSIDCAFEDDVFSHLLAEGDSRLLIALCQFVDGIRAPQVSPLVATNRGRNPLFLQ